jgi:predicted lysophospholipase L1 biosynthesis ABC-type transport system permease subunit
MSPTFDGTYSDRTTLPVVVSQRLADLYQLGVGDALTFSLDDASERTTASIAMITPAIPGADLETAVLLDLGYVLHQQLRLHGDPEAPREFWVDTAHPDEVAAALRPQLPANTRMQSADDPAGRTVLGSAALALWLGALGCLVLAMITVVAVVRAQLRSRRLDVVVLRAIGLGARDQAGIRRRELGLVLGFGILTGLLTGVAVAVLTVPQLARAAVVQPYSTVPTPLDVDLIALGAALGVLLVALAIIVGVYAARVARQARTAIGAEEAG